MQTLAPPPSTVVDPAGRPRFGMYAGAFPEVDLDRARVPGLPGPLASLRLKQWTHWLVVAPEIALTIAIVDAVFTKLVWVQAIDRATGERFEHRREGPLVTAKIARSLWNERNLGAGRGLRVEVHDHLDAGAHHLSATASTPGLPAVDVALSATTAGVEPIAVVLPVGRERGMYSHKVPLPCAGRVRLGDRTVEITDGAAVLDVHKAHYPRETWWRWATAVGTDARGRRIGFNLTENVVTDPSLHENAAWVDGRVRLLGTAALTTSGEAWRAATADGAVDLAFAAQGERGEDLDYRVVRSRFRQRFGTFSGRIRLEGEEVEVCDWFGLMEDHQSRW